MSGSMEVSIKRWPAVSTAAVLVLASTLASAQYMPRQPTPAPQVITIEGSWGYPCLSAHTDCPADAEVDWVPLEVAAWRGGERFTGSFSSDGSSDFTFEVPVQVAPQQRGDLVMLELAAQAPEGHTARFTQIVDVAHRLQAQATSEGRVLRNDTRPRMLSIMTTALTGLLTEANGGDWRMDEARLHELLSQTDPTRVMRHALAFQALVSGTLPGAGSVDPNALVASSVAVEAYLADVPEETLAMVFNQFQTRGRSAYQAIDFAALDLTLVSAAAPGTIAFGRRDGFRLRLRDAWDEQWGGSTLIDTGMTRGLTTLFMIHIDSYPRAARVVRPGQPSFESQHFSYDCPGLGEVEAIRVTARNPDMLRRMAVTAGFEFVEFSEQHLLSYQPLVGDDVLPCAEDLPVFEYVRSYRLAYPLNARGRSFVSLFGGPVALQLLNPDPDVLQEDSQFIAGTLDLATGAVDAPGYAGTGAVSRDPSGLVLLEVEALSGTLREGVVQMRVEGVRGDGMGAQEWVVSSRVTASLDDHARGHVTPAVALDAGFALGTALLEGTWRSGSDVSRPGAVDAMTMSFNAVSGQGVQQAPGEAGIPFSWLVQDGRMVASTFALDSDPGDFLPACPPEATDCREVLRRVWQPLRMGTREALRRVYVIEETWVEGEQGMEPVSRALNFYDAL